MRDLNYLGANAVGVDIPRERTRIRRGGSGEAVGRLRGAQQQFLTPASSVVPWPSSHESAAAAAAEADSDPFLRRRCGDASPLTT